VVAISFAKLASSTAAVSSCKRNSCHAPSLVILKLRIIARASECDVSLGHGNMCLHVFVKLFDVIKSAMSRSLLSSVSHKAISRI